MNKIGSDVASVDGLGLSPSWQASGQAFVGLRASYGTAPDSRHAMYAAELDRLGIARFSYLFLRFGDNVGTPEAQADAAIGVIGAPNRAYFTPVVDLEMSGARPKGWTDEQALDWFLRAWRRMKAAFGADPGVYTSDVVWVDPAQLGNPSCPEIKNAWSWTKYWPFPVRTQAVYSPAIVSALPMPKVAPVFDEAWVMQQYQGDALNYPGYIGTCDLNRVHAWKVGDTGGTVRWIQRKLRIVADGNFGPKTESAVKAFQTMSGLAADGIAGLYTLMRLTWVV